MSEELKDMLESVSVPADLEDKVLGACCQATAAPKPRQKRLVPAVALVACAAVAATVWLSAGDLWQTAPAQKPTVAASTATAATTDSGTATQTTAPSATTTVSTKQTAATTAPTTPPTQSVFVVEPELMYWKDTRLPDKEFERVDGAIYKKYQFTVPSMTLLTMPTTPEAGEITTAFDAATGTLTVSGSGVVKELYPRTITYSEDMTKAEVVAVDTTVKHLVIEEGITEIYNAFNDLAALESVTFPSTLTYMQESFMDCDKLKTLTVPATLKHMRYSCFHDCDSLKNITFQGPVLLDNPVVKVPVEPYRNELQEWIDYTYIGWARAPFCDLDALEEITIPDGSTLFAAFVNCKNLKRANLGSTSGGAVYIGCGFDYPTPPYTSALDMSTDVIDGVEGTLYFGMPFYWSHDDFMAYAYSLIRNRSSSSLWDLIEDWVYKAWPERYAESEYIELIHYINPVPDELNATVGDGFVTLNWEPAEAAEAYYICRQEKGADGWEFIGSTADTVFTDTTVEKGKIYRYALKGPEVEVEIIGPSANVANATTHSYREARPFSYSCISHDCIVW